MIKAIFFDIDGTLVKNNAKALESTKQGIALAKAQGIICGIATGRSPVFLSQQMDELDIDVLVTYNGQLVYTTEEVIRAEPFSYETLNRIISFSDRNHRQIMFGSRNKLEGSSLMQFSQQKWAKQVARFVPKYFPITFTKNLVSRLSIHRKAQRYHKLNILKEPIYQCVLFSPKKEIAMLQEQLPDCHFTRSNRYTLDIIPAGGSKLVGIEACGEYFGFTLDEVMAFGDSWNDIEMLRGVGIGVAMGNAEEEVKKSADYITQTNEEDGIYDALLHYGVIHKATNNEGGNE